MSNKIKPVSLALGAAFIGSFAIATSAFAMNDLSQGYMVSADAQSEKGKEGKCGEGKCGADKKAEKEGKCGEGKCGGAH